MAVDTEHIVPLSADMSGQEFINQLNINLNLAAQSGGTREGEENSDNESPSGINKKIQMQMQLGQLATTTHTEYAYPNWQTDITYTGYICRNMKYDTSLFRKYCHSVLMLNIENCTVVDISVASGETLTIFYYDANCKCKGYVSGTNVSNTIQALYEIQQEDRCYIKIMLKGSKSYTSLRQLDVTISGKAVLTKNDTPSRCTSHYFCYTTSYPSGAETETRSENKYLGTSNYNSTTNQYAPINAEIEQYDSGFIVLPPNYSQDGAPVPLIVYCHGTGGFSWVSGTGYGDKYARIFRFLANNGYAVCDCCGVTKKYFLQSGGVSEARYLPSYVSSLVGLIKFIGNNYNVETNGIYITGKSAGGFMSILLPQLQCFNIKAAAGLSPAMHSFVGMRPGGGNSDDDDSAVNFRNALWKQHNITPEEADTENTGFNNLASYNIYKNVKKLRRYDALFKSTNLTDDEVQTFVKCLYRSREYKKDGVTFKDEAMSDLTAFYNSACAAAGIPEEHDGSTTNNITKDEGIAVRDIMDKAEITINCPIKIWQSIKDDGVSPATADWFVKWAKAGGSPVYLRRFGDRTGDIRTHNLVDEIGNGEVAKKDYKTKYGGEAYEAVAICEMVDFFNQW